mmetsp:Transcript_1079/g.1608  ORF Transcript_1079/g.1608 Transcript_1079/m.1608 type:complete len:421 (+) Transcript_1079:189-1451(+)|eukprot:CAMPEP_0204826114 /NCGR_PEP_ID=MMETSP1346-20131115/3863_1 /ASSEMBLY_ACC=CAM_ASM_000771 /TAXON_ID=215587 /ORGANISM="Aplanochytrium stocchinoi, Strain GSBS06" /LENGTH=420 /DNA_ID=CAMNT_0051953991 /DNA_START=100 /DNA_END=1362 /DNA_ORIENTATION=-
MAVSGWGIGGALTFGVLSSSLAALAVSLSKSAANNRAMNFFNHALLVPALTLSTVMCSAGLAAIASRIVKKASFPKYRQTKQLEDGVKYSYVAGIIGGLGPKASSMFYDKYIVDGRIKLYQAMVAASEGAEDAEGGAYSRLKSVLEISTAAWSSLEVENVWRHTELKLKLSDQDHIPLLLYGNSQIPGRPEYILGKSSIDPTTEMLRTTKALLNAGASSISMVCNTAHYFIPNIEAELCKENIQTEFLDMLELTFEYILRSRKSADDVAKVGVLATRGALETRIFQKTADKLMERDTNVKLEILTPVTPGIGGEQEHFDEAVFGSTGIKCGYSDTAVCEKSRNNMELLLVEALNLVKNGADAIILGCTELPLVLNKQSLAHNRLYFNQKLGEAAMDTLEFVNPTKVLADEILRLTLTSRM